MNALKLIKKDLTIIFIAHRLSTVKSVTAYMNLKMEKLKRLEIIMN